MINFSAAVFLAIGTFAFGGTLTCALRLPIRALYRKWLFSVMCITLSVFIACAAIVLILMPTTLPFLLQKNIFIWASLIALCGFLVFLFPKIFFPTFAVFYIVLNIFSFFALYKNFGTPYKKPVTLSSGQTISVSYRVSHPLAVLVIPRFWYTTSLDETTAPEVTEPSNILEKYLDFLCGKTKTEKITAPTETIATYALSIKFTKKLQTHLEKIL